MIHKDDEKESNDDPFAYLDGSENSWIKNNNLAKAAAAAGYLNDQQILSA